MIWIAGYRLSKSGTKFEKNNYLIEDPLFVNSEYRHLSQLELLLLRDMSIQRRKEGIALTERMEVRYRREGRYFDEILEGDVP